MKLPLFEHYISPPPPPPRLTIVLPTWEKWKFDQQHMSDILNQEYKLWNLDRDWDWDDKIYM